MVNPLLVSSANVYPDIVTNQGPSDAFRRYWNAFYGECVEFLVPICLVQRMFNGAQHLQRHGNEGHRKCNICQRIMRAFFIDNLCQLAVSDDEQYLKIAHLDFWGRKVHTVIAREEIMALSDTGEDRSREFCLVQKYNPSNRYDAFVMFNLWGEFVDREKFNKLLMFCVTFVGLYGPIRFDCALLRLLWV